MEFCSAWSKWGFRPDFVSSSAGKFRRSGVECGVASPKAASRRCRTWHHALALRCQSRTTERTALSRCWSSVSSRGIPASEVDSINSTESVRLLQEHKIDVLVYAGAGILKKPLIEAVPLGVLNAHMGLLPSYRGMNVAEWAAWNRDPVGCSVHLIDSGIDTGDILVVREVDIAGGGNVGEIAQAGGPKPDRIAGRGGSIRPEDRQAAAAAFANGSRGIAVFHHASCAGGCAEPAIGRRVSLRRNLRRRDGRFDAHQAQSRSIGTPLRGSWL